MLYSTSNYLLLFPARKGLFIKQVEKQFLSRKKTKECSICESTFECGRWEDSCWCVKKPVKDIVEGLDCMCPKCFEEDLMTSAEKV